MSTAIRRHTVSLHGHDVCYLAAGRTGPVVVLLHGIAGDAQTWVGTMERLGERHRVIAPDLLGHGRSAKPMGDYSLGAFASGVRDLLALLGHDRASVVGHSLGGGIALQYAYQFPQRCERLVLVASGGLGRELSAVLRAASLPGAELVLPLATAEPVKRAADALGRGLATLGWRPPSGVAEFTRGHFSLADPDARRAFLHTLRACVDVRGQRVQAADRLYLARDLPTLILWGGRDRIIPLHHATTAHEAIPGSVLRVIPRAGHFPQVDDPDEVASAIGDFIAATEPAAVSDGRLQAMLEERRRAGLDDASVAG